MYNKEFVKEFLIARRPFRSSQVFASSIEKREYINIFENTNQIIINIPSPR